MASEVESAHPRAAHPRAESAVVGSRTSDHFESLFMPRGAPAESAPTEGEPAGSALQRNRLEGGIGATATQTRPRRKRNSSSALDWVAFVIAFVVPPLGVLVALAALVVGLRRNGWASAVAKVAVAVALTFSILLAAGGLVFAEALGRQAAHDAIVASSARFCARIQSAPGVLESSTFGWPAVGDSIDDSIPPMKKYQQFWSSLATVSPKGIRPDVESVATAAKGIVTSATTSRVLDDSANVSQLQQVVSASGISEWVAEYCK